MAVTKKTTATKAAPKKPAAKAPAKPAAKAPAAKAPVKKAAAKPAAKPAAKAPAKKPVAAKPAAKPVAKKPGAAVATAFSKTQLLVELAESTELTKKQVSAVLDELSAVIERHVKKNAAGSFTMPGLFKILVVRKPATKARKGINPFTGEETVFKAKPASNAVKIRPLKKLKDFAA